MNKTSLTRRSFLRTTGAAAASSMATSPAVTDAQKEQRPNILVILTDQQSASMMSCAGNPYLKTPAMDSLASTGVRFERAYCTDPVCIPSRFSLMTGRMPGEIGLRSNESAHIGKIPGHIIKQGLGHLFRNAGYDAAYGGKVHLPKMGVEDIGFDYVCEDERDELSRVCAEYIKRRHDRPFLLFASFINPHDICYMAIRDFAETVQAKRLLEQGVTEVAALDRALKLPSGAGSEEFFRSYCPPLPSNFEPQQDEPEAIRMLLAQRPFRKNAREQWTADRWRMHRWAYCRLTEMVDSEIGRVLTALRESGKDKNTVVIFTSDHGDMDSAHRMEHKTVFYDEACRIPLIVSWPGIIPAGMTDDRHLVSNGLDLFPTLCDYAVIDIPDDIQGVSFRSAAEGRESVRKRREFIPVENEIGRMIVTESYKYQVYDTGENHEQLIDLKNDSGEMRNAIGDTDKVSIVHRHRKLFGDAFGNG